MKKGSFFWVSLSDLMTSLFFIMLVLYVVTFVKLKMDQGKMIKELEKLKEIENVETALSTLDSTYFQFDKANKRYKMNIDVHFRPNSWDINDLSSMNQNDLVKAGHNLYNKIDSLTKINDNIDYLLIIEGNTQRTKTNYITDPNIGYVYSYNRALTLYNLWKDNGIKFSKLGNQCEVLIAGSGYFGQSRDTLNEFNNKNFTIQVTSKVGKFLNKQAESNPITQTEPGKKKSQSLAILFIFTFLGLIGAGVMYYKYVIKGASS